MRYFILISGMILTPATPVPANYTDQIVVVPAGTYIIGDGVAESGAGEMQSLTVKATIPEADPGPNTMFPWHAACLIG